MDRRRLLATAAALALAPAAAAAEGSAVNPAPPRPARRPLRIEQLGRVRIDPYAWLRDPNWDEVVQDPGRMSPEIRAHLEAENRYAEAVLAPAEPRRAAYRARMLALAGGDASEPPVEDGPYAYYAYVRPGEDHPVHARRPAAGGAEEVLLDEQARAAGRAYFRTVGAHHSPDHGLFAWAEDVEGADRYRVWVRDLATGEAWATEPDAYGWEGFAFSPCSQWLFWIWRDPLGRPAKVFRRPSRGGADVLVYEEADPALFMSLSRLASNAYAAIHILGPDVDEFRLIPAADPLAEPILVEPRQPGLHYQVQEWNSRLVILTDADGALDGKLMTAPLDAPGRAHWREWIGHEPGRHILALRPLKGHLARLQRRDGRLEVVAVPADGGPEQPVAFDEPAYAVALEPRQAYDTATLRLSWQSPRQPVQWLDIDLAAGARRVVHTRQVGGGYDPDAFEVRRLSAPAPDGEQVPITVLMRKGAALDGRSPLLLHGYGAYGVSTEAEFSIPALALVEQGFVFAIAHVRGGSEKGRRWFLEGRRFSKANSFSDFAACAEHLIAQGYGARGRVVAYGLSAGGLLVAGAANLAPDLWGGIIAQVPFVDMLNTMSDADHPLVPAFRPDWGDPLADPAAYDYIASISPYENVKAAAYPPVLATAGVRDPRVSYWEPAKWIAALRHEATGGPFVFLIDMAAGHQASGGLSAQFDQMARFWAFAEQSLEGAA